jgi:transcriptional regulator with XRE-family HTH domain
MTETIPTGAELRAEREKAGLKLQDVARVLDLDVSLLSKLENGVRFFTGKYADLPDRYLTAVQKLARERAEAVGLCVVEPAA